MGRRGGYRDPGPRKPASGPGKFSQRTDGQVDLDRPDIQYGDVQRLQEARKTAPIPTRGAPRAAPPQTAGPSGRPVEALPPHLFEMDSAFPNEPGSTGLSMGPGAGPEVLTPAAEAVDLREAVLEYLGRTFQNEDAMQALHEYRQRRADLQTPQTNTDPFAPVVEGEGLALEDEDFEGGTLGDDMLALEPEELPQGGEPEPTGELPAPGAPEPALQPNPAEPPPAEAAPAPEAAPPQQ